MDEHGRRARLRPREELSLIRRFFAFVLAVGLTAAALFMMFPSWLNAVAPEINLSRYGIDISRLDIYHFPFYGSAGRRAEGEDTGFGVSDMVEAYADYVEKSGQTPPSFGALWSRLMSRDDLIQTLYDFMIVALLTIPVYMLVRLLAYNTLYEMAESTMWLARVFLRGIVAVSASLVTVSATWFLYKRLLFQVILQNAYSWLTQLTSVKFALNATNIVILLVTVCAVIALLRATLFRGSVFTSILGAVMRTLLYIVLIAVALLAKQGKLKKLLPAKADPLPVYVACGLSAVAMLGALFNATVAYYAMWALAIVVFGLAVYYTVKQL